MMLDASRDGLPGREPTGRLPRIVGGALLAAGLLTTAALAQQEARPPTVAGQVAAPVEIVMEMINGEVRCSPPRARLPAQSPLDFRVVNRAERPLMFVAPQFFQAANVIESAGYALDLVQGGFLARPQATLRVLLRTPQAGEYYYSCYEQGQVPAPQSSGFLIVVPAGS